MNHWAAPLDLAEHFFSSMLLQCIDLLIYLFPNVLWTDGVNQKDPDETSQSAISHLSIYYLTRQKDELLYKYNLFYNTNIFIAPLSDMGLVARKPVFGVFDKASFKTISSATETS